MMADLVPVTDLIWRFPQPMHESDVLMTGLAGALSRQQIFAYLTDGASEHWQNGWHWELSTRLLAAGDWVFKTKGWYCSTELCTVRQRIRKWRALSRKIDVWHPDRRWFVLREDEQFWPCTVTPHLVTLQQIAYVRARQRSHIPQGYLAVLDMRRYLLFLRILRSFGLVLDVKRANFAVQSGGRRLFYIDDELYRFRGWRDLFHGHLRLQY